MLNSIRVLVAIFFFFGTIFLFAGARISPRHLRQSDWYLNTKTDSAGFFSADTLHFFTPYPMWKIVVGNPGDTIEGYPTIHFGDFNKNEFGLDISLREETSYLFPEEYQGKFKISNRGKTLTLDFYKEDNNKPSDDIDDWIKYDSKKYQIIKFSRSGFDLLKMKDK